MRSSHEDDAICRYIDGVSVVNVFRGLCGGVCECLFHQNLSKTGTYEDYWPFRSAAKGSDCFEFGNKSMSMLLNPVG